MGYYTDFHLTIHDAEHLDTDFVDFKIKKCLGWDMYLGYHNMKWYDWREDMVKISKLFPTSYFKLTGHGEEADDVWCAYFKNGKCVIHTQPKWEVPPFDEKDLT